MYRRNITLLQHRETCRYRFQLLFDSYKVIRSSKGLIDSLIAKCTNVIHPRRLIESTPQPDKSTSISSVLLFRSGAKSSKSSSIASSKPFSAIGLIYTRKRSHRARSRIKLFHSSSEGGNGTNSPTTIRNHKSSLNSPTGGAFLLISPTNLTVGAKKSAQVARN